MSEDEFELVYEFVRLDLNRGDTVVFPPRWGPKYELGRWTSIGDDPVVLVPNGKRG